MRPKKLATIRLDFPGAKRLPWFIEGPMNWWKRRHWVDVSVILARDIDEMGDSERVLEATRRRVRANHGWTEEQIREFYPPGRRP
jgi:hypothetical protein